MKSGFAQNCKLTMAAARTGMRLDEYAKAEDPGDVLGWDGLRLDAQPLPGVRLEAMSPPEKLPVLEVTTTRRQRLIATGNARVMTETGEKELQALRPLEDRLLVRADGRIIKSQVVSIRPAEPALTCNPVPRREVPFIFVSDVLVKPIP